jgi:hypothetical protein
MRQVARLVMTALTLSGCAHKSLIQEKTDEFVGQPLSAVTAKLGAPTKEDEIDGTKFYIWSAGPERSSRVHDTSDDERRRDWFLRLDRHRKPVCLLRVDAPSYRLPKGSDRCANLASAVPVTTRVEDVNVQIAVTAKSGCLYHWAIRSILPLCLGG